MSAVGKTEARIEHGGAPVHRHGGRWHGPWESHKDNVHTVFKASTPVWKGSANADLYAKALKGEFRVNWAKRIADLRAKGLAEPPVARRRAEQPDVNAAVAEVIDLITAGRVLNDVAALAQKTA